MKQQLEYAVPTVTGTRVVSLTTAWVLGLEFRDLWEVDRHSLVRVTIKDVWIRQDLGDWCAMLRIVPSKNGNPVVAEVRLFPREPDADRVATGLDPGEWSGSYVGSRAVVPGSGLTARILHAVKVGQARTAGFGIMHGKSDASSTGGPLAGFWPDRSSAQLKGGGRRRIPDEIVVTLAAVYARNFESSNPVVDAAKTCGISRAQARDWLHLARKRGILSAADTTRPHGDLTPKGMEMLKAIRDRAATTPAEQAKGGRGR